MEQEQNSGDENDHTDRLKLTDTSSLEKSSDEFPESSNYNIRASKPVENVVSGVPSDNEGNADLESNSNEFDTVNDQLLEQEFSTINVPDVPGDRCQAFHEVCRSPSQEARDSPENDEVCPAESGTPEKYIGADEESGTTGADEESRTTGADEEESRTTGADEESRTPDKVSVEQKGSRTPQKVTDDHVECESLEGTSRLGEISQDNHLTPKKRMETDRRGSPSPHNEIDFQAGNSSPESENFDETSTINQIIGGNRLSPLTETKVADFVVDTGSFEEYHTSPIKKRRLSPQKETEGNSIVGSNSDVILSRNKKLETPPKESHMLTSNIEEKKCGRTSLASKIKRESLVNSTENVDVPCESTTPGNQDKPKKPTTSAKLNGITKREPKVPYRRAKGIEDSEDISLFLPDDWIFLGSVRQAGVNIGLIDIYYLTPPPRMKLRSRQELVTYMQTHNLNYDPLKFFIRSHIPHLLQKGELIYYDSKTVVSPHVASNESLMATLVKGPRNTIGNTLTEPAVKSVSRKSEKSVNVKSVPKKSENDGNTKKSSDRKSLTQKRESFKNEKSSPVKALPKIERSPLITKPNAVLPVPEIRKTRERNQGSAVKTPAESIEPVRKEVPENNPVIIKEEITSPDNTRKTRLRSSTTIVAPRAASPVSPAKATKRSNRVLELVESDLSPKTPVKGRRRPRKKVPAPSPDSPPSPPQSDVTFDRRVIIQTKPKIVRSPYFSSSSNTLEQPKSSAGRRRDKNSESAPPRSPFNLIQEDLFHDPWQMLIATIFLNSTSGRIAVPLALEFLKRWPTPQEACQAKLYDILDVIEPLGFGRTRAGIIIRFSHEFLTKDWKLPNDLYGIGKYGTDSYKIFCMKNAWKRVDSDDPMLMMYLNWRRATEHLRKKFLNSGNNSKSVDPDETVIDSEVLKKNLKRLPSSQTKQTDLPLPKKRLRKTK